MTVLLLVALPFAAACLVLLGGRRAPRLVAPLAVGATTVTTALAVGLAVRVLGAGRPYDVELGRMPTGGPEIVAGASVDATAATVSVLVCVVALLVQVYSPAYLRGTSATEEHGSDGHDPRYPSYAALVLLFTAAMLLVVVAGDLLVLFVGWEVMTACSYFLIGHEWEREEARAAAVKAFLVTRLGDVGFLFGIFVLGVAAGSFRIADVLAAVPRLSPGALTAATLLLLAGVAGKSAQFPLHVWLPDAMAGPTPVSALIHAATMVAAGVYLVARLYRVFLAAPTSLAVLAVLASVTMLGAALAALAQDDLKRVLAYSTVSQLGYMTAGLAVGGRDPALFHLLSHAAYKALLFLAAGAVIVAAGTTALSRLGGLRRPMPVTFVTMTLGLAALAGVPPLAGFFSKESVLGAAEEAAIGEGPVARWAAWLVLVTGIVTVVVTAAYATRLWLLVFLGPRRDGQPGRAEAVREAPPAMRWPLVVLAVPTALLGVAGIFPQLVPTWIGLPTLPELPEDEVRAGESGSDAPLTEAIEGVIEAPAGFVPGLATTIPSLLLVALGALAAYAAWRRTTAASAASAAPDPAAALGRARPVLLRGFGLDAVYDALLVRPVGAGARLVRAADRDVVDAYVRGSGAGARLLGGALRHTQGGNVQAYLTGLLAGVVLLLVGAVVLT